MFPVPESFVALRDGDVEFVATSAHGSLWAFPRWKGARVLCALSQGMYWFLVVRRDLDIARGDVHALSGMRLAAAPGVDTGLLLLLEAAGIDLQEQDIQVGLPLFASASFGLFQWTRPHDTHDFVEIYAHILPLLYGLCLLYTSPSPRD